MLEQIDAQIAERVMGLKLFTATKEQSAITGGCRVCWGTWIDTGEHHEWGPVVERIPYYSRNIFEAWEIATKLELYVFQDDGLWYAGKRRAFGKNNNLNGGQLDVSFSCLTSGETAPEAICNAALVTVALAKLAPASKD